jgi:hypothetical protein
VAEKRRADHGPGSGLRRPIDEVDFISLEKEKRRGERVLGFRSQCFGRA